MGKLSPPDWHEESVENGRSLLAKPKLNYSRKLNISLSLETNLHQPFLKVFGKRLCLHMYTPNASNFAIIPNAVVCYGEDYGILFKVYENMNGETSSN